MAHSVHVVHLYSNYYYVIDRAVGLYQMTISNI